MTKNTQKSLVARLQEIERISPTIEVDKIKEYKKIVEEFRGINPLVESIIKGETTLSAEAEKAIEIFGGNPYIPHYVGSEHIENFQELMEVIGYPLQHPYNSVNLLANPVIGGIGFGGLMYILANTSKQPKEVAINRRDFLLRRVGLPALGVTVGAVGGLFGTLVRDITIDSARKDAAYVDSMIKLLYKKQI